MLVSPRDNEPEKSVAPTTVGNGSSWRSPPTYTTSGSVEWAMMEKCSPPCAPGLLPVGLSPTTGVTVPPVPAPVPTLNSSSKVVHIQPTDFFGLRPLRIRFHVLWGLLLWGLDQSGVNICLSSRNLLLPGAVKFVNSLRLRGSVFGAFDAPQILESLERITSLACQLDVAVRQFMPGLKFGPVPVNFLSALLLHRTHDCYF